MATGASSAPPSGADLDFDAKSLQVLPIFGYYYQRVRHSEDNSSGTPLRASDFLAQFSLEQDRKSLFADDDAGTSTQRPKPGVGLDTAARELPMFEFYQKVRNPLAKDLVKRVNVFIQALIKSFGGENIQTVEDAATIVCDFLTELEESLLEHPLWRGTSNSEREFAMEGIERHITERLHDLMFCPSTADCARDMLLAKRMRGLSFITLEELDVPKPYRNEVSLALAQSELRKINSEKAPREKLKFFLRACKVLNNMLAMSSSSTEATGADEFFPLLVYTLIHSHVEKLHSCIRFISCFRHPNRLSGEVQYYFTNLVAATCFIESAEPTALHLTEEEFTRRYEASLAAFESSSRDPTGAATERVSDHHAPAGTRDSPGASPGGPSEGSEIVPRNTESIDDLFDDALLGRSAPVSSASDSSDPVLAAMGEPKRVAAASAGPVSGKDDTLADILGDTLHGAPASSDGSNPAADGSLSWPDTGTAMEELFNDTEYEELSRYLENMGMETQGAQAGERRSFPRPIARPESSSPPEDGAGRAEPARRTRAGSFASKSLFDADDDEDPPLPGALYSFGSSASASGADAARARADSARADSARALTDAEAMLQDIDEQIERPQHATSEGAEEPIF